MNLRLPQRQAKVTVEWSMAVQPESVPKILPLRPRQGARLLQLQLQPWGPNLLQLQPCSPLRALWQVPLVVVPELLPLPRALLPLQAWAEPLLRWTNPKRPE